MFRKLSLLVQINLIAALFAAVVLSTMFGIVTGSITAGLMFPMALVSMAAEGEPWGLWIIGSLVLTVVWLASTRLFRSAKAARSRSR